MRRHQLIFLAVLSAFSILTLTACLKSSDLSRDNPYDLTKEDGDHNYAIDQVIIVEETITNNGILQTGEKMYLQVFIKNVGTEPGYISSAFFVETETGTLDFEPQQTTAGITEFTGELVIEDFVEPGTSVMVDSEDTTPGGLPYSIRVEKKSLASAPQETGEVRISDFHETGKWKLTFTINVE